MNRSRISSGTEWESAVGYSRAVLADSHIYVSGTTATGDQGNIVGVGNVYQQTKQALENIGSALREVDASLEDVVRTRIYVTNIDDWEEIGAAHADVFEDIRPATSMVEVSRLIDPKLLVEIEAVAVMPDG